MSHGKSVRILAAIALLAAVAWWFMARNRPSPAEGAGGTGEPAAAGGRRPASDDAVELTLLRETGAAWYCEGDTIQGAWEKAHDALARVAESPAATPQDLVNLACAKLKLHADDAQKQAAESPAIRELCRKALARDSRLGTAHFVLGVVAMDREIDVAAARAAFEQAAACAPDDVAAKLRLADVLNEAGERDRAIEIYRAVRERGPEFAGAFFMTATFRLARLLRQRKQGDDLERSAELLAEHKKLTDSGAANPSDEDIKLGTLARVKLPPARGEGGGAPQQPPPVRFDARPPLLADELAQVSCLEVADLDCDLRDDVVAAGRARDGSEGLWLLAQDATGAFAGRKLLDGAFVRALPVDLENELGMSVLLVRADGGLALLSPDPGGSGGWIDGSAQLPPVPGPVSDAQGVDFNHDGHLDLAFATPAGLRLVRNDGVPRDPYSRDRTGPVKLEDGSAGAGLPTDPIAWVAIEDFDGDQDIDLLVGGPGAKTTLVSSLRKGRFDPIPPERSGLPAELAREPLLADLDHDGRPDVLVAGSPPGLARNRGDGTFEAAAPLPDLAALLGSAAALADVDLNGELDLVGRGESGTVAARFGALAAANGARLELGGEPAPGFAPRLADLDDDGDLDLVTAAGAGRPGVVVRCGSVGGGATSLLLALRGGKDNRGAVGAVVEVRARERYERRLATERKLLFGLAGKNGVDVVRVTWPNGVVQCLVAPASSKPLDEARRCGGVEHAASAPARVVAMSLLQKEGLAGSCPFLYSFDGRCYVFVSDVLGVTPLGLPMSEERYVPPDHDELVRVTSAQLAPAEGEYRLQVTEELREVSYLDRAQLWVVDHEAGVEVHPEERFCFPPFPPQRVHAVRRALPVERAVDQEGRDWTEALAREDQEHAVPFRPLDSRYLGLVTSHWLELTLPEAARSAKQVRLLLTGWLYWTDASVNVLAARNGSIRFVPPTLSVPDGQGGWRETGPPAGFPAGKTKTMVLDVTELLNRDDLRVRMFSTLRLYWDCIRVAVDDGDAPVEVTRLEPAAAKLWFRGFSAEVEDGRDDQPARFDWERLEPIARWNQHRGMLTRYGDVRPLLGDIDDRFAILSAGDAIDLRFDARGVAPVAAGRERTFLLFLDGWAKDADPNTTYSQTVEPLPFHGMSGYPYRADESFPDDDLHVDYLLEWNTRPGRRLIPDLAQLPREAAPEGP
jgi:tetratricopeptide (TPR) repeat protein